MQEEQICAAQPFIQFARQTRIHAGLLQTALRAAKGSVLQRMGPFFVLITNKSNK